MIDFVVTWVDGSDPSWIAEYNKYVSNDKRLDVSNIRYRDNGLLRYWFRCIDTNASWVHKVHFITNGQIPDWLNQDSEKLNIVKHSDYIPVEYLPVFNSHPIENYMHKIPGLSEKFVYFNDDFFIINPISEDYFFTPQGIIKDFAGLYNLPMTKFGHILLNNEIVLRTKYDIGESILQNKEKWFSKKDIKNLIITKLLFRWRDSACVHWSHFGQPYTKTIFNEAWNQFAKDFDRTMNSKFRSDTDVSHYLIRSCFLLQGNFEPSPVFKTNKYMDLTDSIDKICSTILNSHYKQLVINDQEIEDSEDRYRKIMAAFEAKFPFKSQFEV